MSHGATLSLGMSSSGMRASGGAGSLHAFSASRLSPGSGSTSMQRDESYHLLLELSSQEPTMQACFKIIESTCFARYLSGVRYAHALSCIRCMHEFSCTDPQMNGAVAEG